MTHYEEFCIPSSATEEEIRLAHRRLIKMLHPDHQQDESTRRLAETQTCRLNLIAETLLDPRRRNEYDRLLTYPAALRTRRFRLQPWTAIPIALLIAALLIFSWNTMPQSATASESDQPHADRRSSSDPPRRANHSRPADTRKPVPEPQPATQELDQVQPLQPPEPAPEHIAPVPLPEPPPPAINRPENLQESEGEEEPAGLTGTWLYVQPAHLDDAKNLYRPEYIEMRIREIDGHLEGDYKARYKITDRALSPNVTFHFSGPAGPAISATFGWKGTDGVLGLIRLSLSGRNSLKTDWNVTQGATSADLIAGNAILTRAK